MSNAVLHPTPEILKTTDLIDQGIVRFIQARFTVTLSGRESDVESMLLLNLVIRNMYAILELARRDIVLLPAANVLARAVFEIAIKSAWMVQPDDPYMRELRWLVHLEEEARLHEQIVTRVTESGGDPSGFQERAAICRGFANGVSGKLPPGYQKIRRNPDLDSMLKDIGQKKMYTVYRMLAAYVHGGHASTWLYRKHLAQRRKLASSSGQPTGTCRCGQVGPVCISSASTSLSASAHVNRTS